MPAGRPTAYKAEFCKTVIEADLIRAAGATDLAIATELGVDPATVWRWKKQHEEFAEACRVAKEVADDVVEASLFRRANGYSQEAVKIFMPQGAPEPVYAPYLEHYPPDVGAALNWLKNRRPDRWRERVEHTGPDGGPIVIASALEAARRRAAVDVPFKEVKSLPGPAEEGLAGALKAERSKEKS